MAGKKPNILFIMCDQMRGDSIGIAGHPYVKTPHIDSLAREGIRFSSAYSQTPSCIPARAGLYTGMSQKGHRRVGYEDGITWDYEKTMATELSKAGYYTQSIGKMHVHPERNLIGFHNVELHNGCIRYYRQPDKPFFEHQKHTDDYLNWLKEHAGSEVNIFDTGLDCNSWVSRPWIYEEKLHPTNWVVTRCIDFLRRRDRDKPFFLMASFVRPHPPFDAPKCYFYMYQNIDFEKPIVGDWADKEDENLGGRDYCCFEGILDKESQRQAQMGYLACITHIDHQIGRLIQGLYEAGVWDNTVIIFTSDHGEMLGDHNMYRKGWPYQGSINIPLIINGKNLGIKGYGNVADQVVELRDIMPTLLEVANAKIPDSVEGKSLLSLIKNKDRDLDFREYLHGEHSGGKYSNHFIVTKEDKYIWFSQSGKEQYFRIKEDPKEINNLIKDSKWLNRIKYLRKILIKELEGRIEGYSDGKKLILRREPRTHL